MRVLLALLLPLIVMIAFSASALAAGPKADICHWANHKYVQINVSENALPAHLQHGDVLPDSEYGDCP